MARIRKLTIKDLKTDQVLRTFGPAKRRVHRIKYKVKDGAVIVDERTAHRRGHEHIFPLDAVSVEVVK